MSENIMDKDRLSVKENDFYTIQIMKLRKDFYLWEMAALLLNVNPLYVKVIERGEFKIRQMVADYSSQESKLHPKHFLYKELLKAMIDAVDYGEIELFGDELHNFELCQQTNLRESHGQDTGSCAGDFTTVNRYAVQAWVEKFNFETNFFEAKKPAELPLPRYLDKNHPEHSLELGIAIEAWERFSDLGISHPKDYLEKWLKEKHESLSDKAIDRIKTVINWNRSGGAPTDGLKSAIYQQALDKEITTFSTQPKQ